MCCFFIWCIDWKLRSLLEMTEPQAYWSPVFTVCNSFLFLASFDYCRFIELDYIPMEAGLMVSMRQSRGFLYPERHNRSAPPLSPQLHLPVRHPALRIKSVPFCLLSFSLCLFFDCRLYEVPCVVFLSAIFSLENSNDIFRMCSVLAFDFHFLCNCFIPVLVVRPCLR